MRAGRGSALGVCLSCYGVGVGASLTDRSSRLVGRVMAVHVTHSRLRAGLSNIISAWFKYYYL